MTQTAELKRVKLKIGDLILEFYYERILIGQFDFHANDLATYINRQIPNTTFDSASRILRDMRNKRELNYEVVSRRDSHYRFKRFPSVQQEINL